MVGERRISQVESLSFVAWGKISECKWRCYFWHFPVMTAGFQILLSQVTIWRCKYSVAAHLHSSEWEWKAYIIQAETSVSLPLLLFWGRWPTNISFDSNVSTILQFLSSATTVEWCIPCKITSCSRSYMNFNNKESGLYLTQAILDKWKLFNF